MNSSDAVLDFRLAPEPRASRAVRESVAKLGTAHGIADDDMDLFLTALGEAIANSVEHGKYATSEILISVEVRIDGDRILGTVRDNGCGFTPNTLSEPVLPDANSERGRGLPIIRRCSDIFAVTSSPGKGTAVVLGRYFRRNDEASVA